MVIDLVEIYDLGTPAILVPPLKLIRLPNITPFKPHLEMVLMDFLCANKGLGRPAKTAKDP